MLRASAPPEAVEAFITAIGTAVGDEELRDRVRKIRRVAQILKKGNEDSRKVFGWPTLAEIIGKDSVRLVRNWLGLKDQVEPFPLELVHSVAEFVSLLIPPREPILDGLLLTKSLVEVFSKRGVGKTFFTLSLCLCIARGTGKFMEWPVHKARRVLYVDGEMSGSELQERLRKFCAGNAPRNLDILASDTFYQLFQTSMNLASVAQQEQFMGLLDALEAQGRLQEVVALDNKSALTCGTEENSNTEQQGFGNFLKALRHRGLTAVVVHHAGKTGDQRGASGFEDPFDLVIKLEEPKADDEASIAEGAEFAVSFTKHRNLRKPEPYSVLVELVEDLNGTFDWAITKPKPKKPMLKVLEYLYDKPGVMTQAQVADACGSTRALSKLIKGELRSRQFLSKAVSN